MDKNSKIYVAGHTGLVGSAFVRKLWEMGYHNLVLRTHRELDLLDQAAVQAFFAQEKPEYVIDAAAKVGGIRANSEAPADFFYENMQMEQNLIWSSKPCEKVPVPGKRLHVPQAVPPAYEGGNAAHRFARNHQ